MRLHRNSIAALAVALAPLVSTAEAQLSGSVTSTAGNGFNNGSFLCKQLNVTREINGLQEAVGSDWTSFCVGYYSVDVGPSSIFLRAVQWGNYSYASLNLHFTGSQAISNVTFGGYSGNFFDPNWSTRNQSNLLPVITFDADDINITWNTGDNANQFAFQDGGALFNVSTVPEPASMTLLAAGLAGLAGAAKRRKAKAA